MTKEQWVQLFIAEMKFAGWDVRHMDENMLYARFSNMDIRDAASSLSLDMAMEWDRLHGI